MKKKTHLLSLLLVLTMFLAFVPAGAQAADETPYDLRVLTFEDADYKGGTNFAGGSNWTSLIDDPQYGGKLLYGSGGAGVSTENEAYKWTDENNTMLSHVFPYNYSAYCYWGGGHAISNYGSGDIADYGGFNKQLTVYKKGVSGLTRTGAGHNGSDNFAVHYGYIDGSEYNKTEVLPSFSFADGVERVVDHMYITNTTYALNCYIDGNGLTAKIGDDDWVKVVAIGYDANGEKTGETGIYLCNGPDNIVMDWTKWDLSVLGKVYKVAFNVTGSSDNGYGFSQPAYFAYDDVTVRFEKPVSATGIEISSSKLELSVGETALLTATLTPANTTEAVVWTSTNDDVAAVENGTVTAKKTGSATIRATCGSVKAECSVTVVKKDVKAEYIFTMPADKSVNAGEAVAIPVTLGYTTADETTFHAADITFTYDTAKLTYGSVTIPDQNCTVTEKDGTIRVLAYGEAKDLGAAVFTLNFTAKTDASGTANVKVTSAKIDKSANAVAKDAPEAQLEDDLTVITIKGTHNVTLDEIFTGDSTVADGADYTFSKTDKDESHYDYSDVKATVNGENVDVIDNGDGTYTVKNVTGDLTVTGKRTPKTYTVKVEGTGAEDVTAASSATYGTDFTFNLDRKDGFQYTVTVTVGGKSVTPNTTDDRSYTIPGAGVTGNIVIIVTKDAVQVEMTTVKFEGTGAGDVEGGMSQDTPTGKEFTFTIKKDANYDYTVKLGDEVLAEADGKYTIPGGKVTAGTITVTVEKTVSTQGVNVRQYVKLENQQSVWLVTVEGDAGDGKVYAYGGERMFKTTKYGTNGTYAYLVIAPALSVEDAAVQLGITAGEAAGTVSYGGDVNGSSVIDINDAQLVYDMYNAHYADFTTVSMYKFLCADIADNTPEGSTLLNVSDAVAVIDKINK